MAESDSRNTSGKQLPTVLGNRQILSPQTEGASDEKPKNPKWANIMVDTCSPSSTCEPEPSPVHTTASESSSTDEYRTQSFGHGTSSLGASAVADCPGPGGGGKLAKSQEAAEQV